MRARLLTRAAAPEDPERPNEDVAGVLGAAAVLIDGAGMPARFRAGCSHSVAWYARTLTARLLLALQDEGAELQGGLALAIGEVAALHAGTCDLDRGGPSATVLAVRVREGLLEHLVLADSSVLLERADGTIERISDERVEETVRAHRDPEVVESLRNAPGGFWVARHEVEAAGEALVGAVPLADLRRVHLVSDGVTRAVDLLGLVDDDGLAAALRTDPEGLLDRIREAELALDPARRQWKIHDDATLLVLEGLDEA